MSEFSSLVELFEVSTRDHADRSLFGTRRDGTWEWITYADFKALVDQFRGGLISLGVERGDAVAIISNNRVEWAVAAYASYSLGACYVPMYEAQTAPDWEYILRDCEAKVVICSTDEIYAEIKSMIDRLPELRHAVGLDAPVSDDHSYTALLGAGQRIEAPPIRPTGDDLMGLVYTSGTTGKPKGVKLSHSNIVSNVLAIRSLFPFSAQDRSLSFLPWAHSFGQTCDLHGLMAQGASIAINDEIPNLVGNLAEVRPTILIAVPRIFNRIYDGVVKQMAERGGRVEALFHRGIAVATKKNAGEPIGLRERIVLALADRLIFSKVRAKFGGRLEYAISGSAALNRDVARFIDGLGIEVYEGYGLSETSPIVTANYPGHRKIGSVGPTIPGVSVIIDDAATADPAGGEIVVYGPNVMQGYHNRDEENAKVIMDDGGFRTGDIGRVDEDGFLYITGRIKEQYKLENGKYVVPSPLEEELKLSPYIANIMIYGMNRPFNVALVVPDPAALESWATENHISLGDVSTDARVKELLREELTKHSKSFKRYELPRDIAVVAEEFTTDNGMLTPTLKLKRRVVLERYGDRLDALYA